MEKHKQENKPKNDDINKLSTNPVTIQKTYWGVDNETMHEARFKFVFYVDRINSNP